MSREQYELPSAGAIVGKGGGWGFWADAENGDTSRQTMLAGVKYLFTSDGLGPTTETGYLSTLDPSIWDGSAIHPLELGEAYLLRVSGNVSPQNNTTGYLDATIDIGVPGGAEIIILDKRIPLTRGVGQTIPLNDTHDFFVGAPFLANGGRIYITPSDDIEVWDRGIKIQRTFSP